MSVLLTSVALALAAMLAELALGYPDRLYRRIGHPVSWIGALIAALDRRWNRADRPGPARRRAGLVLVAVLLGLAVLTGGALQAGIGSAGSAGLVLGGVLLSSLIAQRSLHVHVAAVATALEQNGLAAGRVAVARIVGRDPERLDEAGVCRAAIESLAENFSDGVVAPVLWLAVLGPAGAIGYKAVNTADSMIGHRTPRHVDFGRAAARLDDAINLPASRLSALLIAAAALWPEREGSAGTGRVGEAGAGPGGAESDGVAPGGSVRGASARGAAALRASAAALGAVVRDARHHRSPNAGWPEAAMAGALGISLAGPRYYGGTLTSDREMNAGARRDLGPGDIRRALALYRRADAVLLAGLVALLWGLWAWV